MNTLAEASKLGLSLILTELSYFLLGKGFGYDIRMENTIRISSINNIGSRAIIYTITLLISTETSTIWSLYHYVYIFRYSALIYSVFLFLINNIYFWRYSSTILYIIEKLLKIAVIVHRLSHLHRFCVLSNWSSHIRQYFLNPWIISRLNHHAHIHGCIIFINTPMSDVIWNTIFNKRPLIPSFLHPLGHIERLTPSIYSGPSRRIALNICDIQYAAVWRLTIVHSDTTDLSWKMSLMGITYYWAGCWWTRLDHAHVDKLDIVIASDTVCGRATICGYFFLVFPIIIIIMNGGTSIYYLYFRCLSSDSRCLSLAICYNSVKEPSPNHCSLVHHSFLSIWISINSSVKTLRRGTSSRWAKVHRREIAYTASITLAFFSLYLLKNIVSTSISLHFLEYQIVGGSHLIMFVVLYKNNSLAIEIRVCNRYKCIISYLTCRIFGIPHHDN